MIVLLFLFFLNTVFSHLGYSLRCYYGQNFLERTGNDKSGIPVSKVTCSSGQGCGTVNYQYSFVDKYLRRSSASVVQGVCADFANCARPSVYCQNFRNNLVNRGFTIHYCQVCSEVTQA